MNEEGHAVRCVGKPHLIMTSDGLRRVVNGCSGPSPQIRLKD
jgi:hypothetical protein